LFVSRAGWIAAVDGVDGHLHDAAPVAGPLRTAVLDTGPGEPEPLLR
jgi:hypothetical protein